MGADLKSLKPFGTLIGAASAASAAASGVALAQDPVNAWQGYTVSFEGGIAFADRWQSTFPGTAASLLPAVTDPDKTGLPPTFSENGYPHMVGGYGSFSLGRTIDPTLDWRFSAGIYDFGSRSRSSTASQDFPVDPPFSFFGFTNTAFITESNRFGFLIGDFDFGKTWSQGSAQFRAFAGVRALHTIDRFNRTIVTEGTDKIGILTFATTDTSDPTSGSSHFTGVGPRVGLEFFYGPSWGIVGSVSGALIGGYRYAHVDHSTFVVVNGIASGTAIRISDNGADWVGNLSGMLGVSFPTTTGQLVVGYKIDQWFNIRDSFSFAGFDNKRDLLTQTPFIKVVLRY